MIKKPFIDGEEARLSNVIIELRKTSVLIVHKLNLITIYSGKDFYYVYPNGDKCANVIASY